MCEHDRGIGLLFRSLFVLIGLIWHIYVLLHYLFARCHVCVRKSTWWCQTVWLRTLKRAKLSTLQAKNSQKSARYSIYDAKLLQGWLFRKNPQSLFRGRLSMVCSQGVYINMSTKTYKYVHTDLWLWKDINTRNLHHTHVYCCSHIVSSWFVYIRKYFQKILSFWEEIYKREVQHSV